MSYWIAKIITSYSDETSYVEYHTIESDDRATAYEMAQAMVPEELRAQSSMEEPRCFVGSLRPYSAFVAMYDCGQGDGGPEEGGWWYDYGQPDEGAFNLMRVFENPDEAAEYLESLRDMAELMNQSEHRYRHSARDTGWYDAFLSYEMPKPFPEKIPHYE